MKATDREEDHGDLSNAKPATNTEASTLGGKVVPVVAALILIAAVVAFFHS